MEVEVEVEEQEEQEEEQEEEEALRSMLGDDWGRGDRGSLPAALLTVGPAFLRWQRGWLGGDPTVG